MPHSVGNKVGRSIIKFSKYVLSKSVFQPKFQCRIDIRRFHVRYFKLLRVLSTCQDQKHRILRMTNKNEVLPHLQTFFVHFARQVDTSNCDVYVELQQFFILCKTLILDRCTVSSRLSSIILVPRPKHLKSRLVLQRTDT